MTIDETNFRNTEELRAYTIGRIEASTASPHVDNLRERIQTIVDEHEEKLEEMQDL